MPVKVQGPDGQTYSFPDGTDKAAAVTYFKRKGIGVSAPSAAQPAAVAPAQSAPVLKQAFDNFREGITGDNGLLQFGKGAVKGAVNTAANLSGMIDSAVRHVPGLDKLPPPTSVDAAKRWAEPSTGAQQAGKAAEQVGEFFIPGAAEEALLGKIGSGVLPRIAVRAASSGLVNKAQGGEFVDGAITGAAGEGLVTAFKKAAPKIAETALKVRGTDKVYGAKPGRAILDLTDGMTPSRVQESGTAKIEQRMADKLDAARNASGTVDMTAPQAGARSSLDTALARNNKGTIKDVEELNRQLTSEYGTNVPIPKQVTAERAVELQRGLGDLRDFSPKGLSTFSDNAAGRAYHELGGEIEKVAPETVPINADLRDLIPVVQRAKMADLTGNLFQKLSGRATAHTGALAGTLAGYATHGLPGAVTGFVLPELVGSPEFQLALARGANSPILRNLLPAAEGATLSTFDRAAKRKKESE